MIQDKCTDGIPPTAEAVGFLPARIVTGSRLATRGRNAGLAVFGDPRFASRSIFYPRYGLWFVMGRPLVASRNSDKHVTRCTSMRVVLD